MFNFFFIYIASTTTNLRFFIYKILIRYFDWELIALIYVDQKKVQNVQILGLLEWWRISYKLDSYKTITYFTRPYNLNYER